MNNMNKFSPILLLVAFVAKTSFADVSSNNFVASSTLNASCSLGTVNNVDFGNITLRSTQINLTKPQFLNIKCSKDVQATLSLTSPSFHPETSDYRMTGTGTNTDEVKYFIFLPGVNKSLGPEDYVFTSTGEPISLDFDFTIRRVGPLPIHNKYFKPDTYTDTLTLNISY